MSRETQPSRTVQLTTYTLLALSLLAAILILVAYPDARTRQLFQASMFLAVATAALAVPIGVTLAWLVARTNLVGRRPLMYALVAGVLLPLYLQAAVWEAGFGRLGWFPLPDNATVPLLSGWKAALWVHLLAAIPWVSLFVLAQLHFSPTNLEETALLDTTPWNVFLRVTLLQLLPISLFSALWVTIWVASEMTVTDLFQVRTFAEEVYVGFAIDGIGGPSDATPSIWAGICFLVMLILLSVSACLLIAPRLSAVSDCQVFLYQLRWLRVPMTLLVAVVVLVTAAVPIVNLIIKAGTEVVVSDEQVQTTWKMAKVLQLTARSWWEFRSEIGWSLVICQLASLTACTISILLYALAQHSRLVQVLSLLLAAFCLALPGPLLGIATVRTFSFFQNSLVAYLYSHTITAPWLTMSIKCLPLVMLLTWIAMRISPADLVDAARNAGASGWQSLWHVVIPARQMAFLLAFLAGVVFCVGDLAASILVVPPGVTTLAISIFGMIHSGVEDRLAALCLASTCTLLILGVLICWTFRWVMIGRR